MRRQRGSAEFLLVVIVALLFYAVIWIGDSKICTSKWERSGLQTDFGLFSGCLVRTPSGRWMPEDSVRDIDLSVPPQKGLSDKAPE